MTSSRELEGRPRAEPCPDVASPVSERSRGARRSDWCGAIPYRRSPRPGRPRGLLYTLSRRSRDRNDRRVALIEEESIPILNIGQARIYDPDTSPRHPTQDLLETRRETSARA